MTSPTWLRIIVAVLILFGVGAAFLSIWWGPLPLHAAGNLAVVLSLAVLIVYAYHTFLLARDAWTPSASFVLRALPNDPYHFAFLLQNHSKLSLNCWCNLNATIYGQPVASDGFYGGKSSFDLQPFGSAMGHFNVRDLLAKSNRTIEEMRANASVDSTRQQLRLNIDFWYNPVGVTTPTHNVPQPHYFDFRNEVIVADF